MPSNLLRRRSGPAFIHYRGVTFYTKDAITFDPQLQPFTVEDDAHGVLDNRLGGRVIKVQFTPNGVWTAAMLAVLYPGLFTNYQVGQYNTPIYECGTVTPGGGGIGGTIAIPNHGQIAGTGVRLASTGTMPAGLSDRSTYYLVYVDSNTISLADTEDHAIAGTNLVNITDAGTGELVLVQNTPLTIQYLDAASTYITLWNAGITTLGAANATTA